MKPKLLAIYLVIVLLPLAVVAGMGAALARNEQALVEMRFQELMTGRLDEIARQIDAFIESRERELIPASSAADFAPGELRRLSLASPIARQYFLLDPSGELVYPSPAESLTADELAFLKRTEEILERGDISAERRNEEQAGAAVYEARSKMKQAVASQRPQPPLEAGWYVGYGDRDLRLIYWIRDADGFIIGSEVNEVRLQADILAIFPDSGRNGVDATATALDGRIALADSHGRHIYHWGPHVPSEKEQPKARLPLHPPLAAWSLLYFAPVESGVPGYGGGSFFYIGSGLIFLFAALSGLAVYFYRENTRAFREAQQRVSFVNQVSHELKVPLTNIRMYAEMLDEELAEAEGPAKKRLGIIVAESQRLSRLIGNVLTFNREKRGGFSLHPKPGVFDETVAGVVAHFESAFDARDLKVCVERGAPAPAEYDADVVEQIVANLLSNVEKYVPKGCQVWVESSQEGGRLRLHVRDDGPGIPPSLRRQVFEPFFRPSNKLTDGVSGVGLGLTIARQLAQLHGGDLVLEAIDGGASFVVTIDAPLTTQGGKK